MILGGSGGGFPKINLARHAGSVRQIVVLLCQVRARRNAGLPRGGMEDRYNTDQKQNKTSDAMRGFSVSRSC